MVVCNETMVGRRIGGAVGSRVRPLFSGAACCELSTVDRPSLGTWAIQDPAQYINGANTRQFVESSPVGRVDANGEAGWLSDLGVAVGLNGGAAAQAFWTGAAEGAGGGTSIVINTVSHELTDRWGWTDSSQYQGGAYGASRGFAWAGSSMLDAAAIDASGEALGDAFARGAEETGGMRILGTAIGTASASAGIGAVAAYAHGDSLSAAAPQMLLDAFIGGLTGTFGGGVEGGNISRLESANGVPTEASLLGYRVRENPQLGDEIVASAKFGNLVRDIAADLLSDLTGHAIRDLFGGAGCHASKKGVQQ